MVPLADDDGNAENSLAGVASRVEPSFLTFWDSVIIPRCKREWRSRVT